VSEVHREIVDRVDVLDRLYDQFSDHDKLDQARFSEIRDRLARIDLALFGDGNARKGIIEHVESLVEITRVGRSTFRVFIWFGAAVVAIATASWQFKQAITGLLH
jgi:hypothetical protein